MKVALLANDSQLEELNGTGEFGDNVLVAKSIPEFLAVDAALYIDLLFDNTAERIDMLKNLFPATVMVGYVRDKTDPAFVRLNNWNSFLHRNTMEATAHNEVLKAISEKGAAILGKTIIWTNDIAGFITPRVVSMIINEAYIALSEGISTKEEIDVAMKLGTNYPFGPFEWAHKIGIKQIAELLNTLSGEDPRYTPADLLLKEAL